MARHREFDEAEALKTLKELFWREGYEGASYADIMSATGLGKGSLYAAFGEKRSLYLKALAAYVEAEVADAAALLNGEGDAARLSGRKRIEAFLEFPVAAVADEGDRRGCFLCNASVELAPFDKDVEAAATQAMSRLTTALKTALSEGGKQRPGVGEHLLATYFGLRVMAKAGVAVDALKRARNAALAAL